MSTWSSRAALILPIAATTLALAAPVAAADPILVRAADECETPSLSQPFRPWVDIAPYTLLSGGDFEGSLRDWTLSGGVGVVHGNEPFQVTASSDSRSLAIPVGGQVTTASICVGVDEPTVRLCARRTAGPPLGSLKVEVLFPDEAGKTQQLTLAQVLASGLWAPTPPLVVVANLLPLLSGDQTPVRFRLTAQDADFQVDDVYVDPWRAR
jgi:hypothetical protein